MTDPTRETAVSYDINRLIAEVKVLRERVAELEEHNDAIQKAADFNLQQNMGIANLRMKATDARAEASEAHATELAAALKPFCGPGGGGNMPAFHDMCGDDVVWSNSGVEVTVGDCRRARATLAKAKESST